LWVWRSCWGLMVSKCYLQPPNQLFLKKDYYL
jgi:hypothetical protein